MSNGYYSPAAPASLAPAPDLSASQDDLPEGFTPCFDWVAQLTHDPVAALTYGAIWRYCQMSHHCCYASHDRLAAHLGCSRRTILRHLHTLLALGLIVDLTPQAVGVTHCYVVASMARAWGQSPALD